MEESFELPMGASTDFRNFFDTEVFRFTNRFLRCRASYQRGFRYAIKNLDEVNLALAGKTRAIERAQVLNDNLAREKDKLSGLVATQTSTIHALYKALEEERRKSDVSTTTIYVQDGGVLEFSTHE